MDCHKETGLMETDMTAMMSESLIEFPTLWMSVAFSRIQN